MTASQGQDKEFIGMGDNVHAVNETEVSNAMSKCEDKNEENNAKADRRGGS